MTTASRTHDRVLEASQWHPLAAAHRERAERWTVPHLGRRASGLAHPVWDFLFDYYPHEPAKLARWHPGVGTALRGDGAEEYAALAAYHRDGDVVTLDLARLERRCDGLRWARDLMVRTAGRPPRLDCFGLHEWAMVHRGDEHGRRHVLPLRLGQSGTDAVTESHRVRCTHVDAFRFFSPSSRDLNEVQPTRATQPDLEQPGCLHATMDLYRWASKLAPYGDSSLLLDCFELAADVRLVDMRASPYDLRSYDLAPIRIEVPDGKAEYVRLQRDFVERAAVLRDRLVADHDRVLAAAPAP